MKVKDYGDIPDRCPPSSRRHGITLCQPMEEKRFHKWEDIALVQPKLDGERCRIVVDFPKVTLISSEENEIVSVPHINDKIAYYFKHAFPHRFEFDGELYNHDMDFDAINSIVSRTVNLHSDYEMMQFHTFDIADKAPQIRRTQLLSRLMSSFMSPRDKSIQMVSTDYVTSLEEAMIYYDRIRSRGYEGIILRHPAMTFERKRSLFMMKFKPKKSDTYQVVGYEVEKDKYGKIKEGRLGSLKLRGEDGTIFGVGSGLTDLDRITLWDDRKNLHGRGCKISYQHRTANGIPRFPVYIELLEKGTATEAETPEGFRFG